ncbi:MAG: methyltransferase, partial [Gammaproteobacteria bacterium]|nr:methyltransferase [Gammaproteobacteria bacterium]
MNIQKCYLCNCESHIQRPGIVRDNNGLKVLQCTNCDLVFLSSFDHISREHYSESGMHGGESVDVDNWIKDTAEDDERRFNFLKTKMTNRNVLDFGCGNGGFIERAKSI